MTHGTICWTPKQTAFLRPVQLRERDVGSNPGKATANVTADHGGECSKTQTMLISNFKSPPTIRTESVLNVASFFYSEKINNANKLPFCGKADI